MIAFSIFAVLLRLLGTLGGVPRRTTGRPARRPGRHAGRRAGRHAGRYAGRYASSRPGRQPARHASRPAEPIRPSEPVSQPEPTGSPQSARAAEPVARVHEGDEHPESLTADLDPDAEEYLAWLADHHWPADEYLELERDWYERGWYEQDWPADLESYEPAPERTACPQCRRQSEDVWPCWTCGRLLHSACRHGMRRRPVPRPYRTRDMNAEAVTAEWICTDCSCVVGLDVEQGGEQLGGDADK
jgi:hypothetical protein